MLSKLSTNNNTKTSIVWFRQDLTTNNTALVHARKSDDHLLYIYIMDTQNKELNKSLTSLQKELKGKLFIYEGNPITVLLWNLKKYTVNSIYWSKCQDQCEVQQDEKIKSLLQRRGVEVYN